MIFAISRKFLFIKLNLLAILLIITFNINADEPIQLANDKFVRNSAYKSIKTQLNKLKQSLEMIKLNRKNALQTSNDKRINNNDFNWITKIPGISITPPAIDPLDNDVIVAVIDINQEIILDLIEGKVDLLNTFSSLYALKPNSEKPNRRNNGKNIKWVINGLRGAAVFPPIVLKNATVLVSTVDGGFNTGLFEGTSRLFSISDNGNHRWQLQFDKDETFVSSPVIAPNGNIIVSTIKITPLSISPMLRLIDPINGEILWSIDENDIETDDFSFFFITPPAVNENGDFYVSALGFAKSHITRDPLIEIIKQNAKTVDKLVNDTINDFAEIIKSDNLENSDLIINNFIKEIKPILNDSAEELLKDRDDLAQFVTCIYKIDRNNGEIEWQTILQGDSLFAPLIVNDESLIIGKINYLYNPEIILRGLLLNADLDSDTPENTISLKFHLDLILETRDLTKATSSLVSIDTDNGAIMWSSDFEDIVHFTPVLSKDEKNAIVPAFLFLNDNPSKLYSIDVDDGATKWNSTSFDGVIGQISTSLLNKSPLLTGNDGSTYFPIFDFEFTLNGNNGFATDAEIQAVTSGGSLKWIKPFTNAGFLFANPTIDNNDDSIFLNIIRTDNIVSIRNQNEAPPDELPDGIKRRRDRRKERRDKEPTILLQTDFVKLNPINGEISKSVKLEGFGLSSPIIDNDLNQIYTITSDALFENGRGIGELTLEPFSLVHAKTLN